jgi:tRNA wybutosine-synthesizing protein 2
MAERPPLAAVVPKSATEAAIAALREAGVYDDTRRVREHDADAVEVPVSERAAVSHVERYVEQADPERRAPDLDALLRERGFDAAERERAPSSWAVVGDVLLADFEGCPRREAVGEALLELHGEADTALHRNGVSGEFREPDVEVVAGAGHTETVHVEHGTKYALDLAETMFSPGNKAERARMGEVVAPGESVFDMFAGVGYFALPMARAGADVLAAEKNPVAARRLVENAALNGVGDRLRPVRADCRDVATTAERVVMGHYDAHEFLDAALAALEPGGTLHLHEATPEATIDRPERHLREACADAGRAVETAERRRVKTHSAGVVHVVVDAEIG